MSHLCGINLFMSVVVSAAASNYVITHVTWGDILKLKYFVIFNYQFISFRHFIFSGRQVGDGAATSRLHLELS